MSKKEEIQNRMMEYLYDEMDDQETVKLRICYRLKAMRNTLTNSNIQPDYLNHE